MIHWIHSQIEVHLCNDVDLGDLRILMSKDQLQTISPWFELGQMEPVIGQSIQFLGVDLILTTVDMLPPLVVRLASI